MRGRGGEIAVFGDYDADGICSSAIMYYALKEYGVRARIYVPERSDGYGLSRAGIDRIFAEGVPDLFMTVDCGVSCKDEVAYAKSLGTEVIVTDHHELPEELPDCVIVNPKNADDYPYDNLCGAGVAFKVACALLGEKAYDLLDFAALATVADSVPLLGENRDIVTEGLKLFNADHRSCFTYLLARTKEKQGDEITAQTLAFTLAPRVNAAGEWEIRTRRTNCLSRKKRSENGRLRRNCALTTWSDRKSATNCIWRRSRRWRKRARIRT